MTTCQKGELFMVINYHCGELLSPAIQSLLEKKLAKFDKYNLDGVFDVYMTSQGKDFTLKIQLTSKEYDLFVKSVSKDMYKNIDDCVDKLNSQLVAKKQ